MMLAKLENGQLKIADGKVLRYDNWVVSNPREEDFVKVGYKPVEINSLPQKEGYYQVPEYTEEDDKIVVNYRYEELHDEEIDA